MSSGDSAGVIHTSNTLGFIEWLKRWSQAGCLWPFPIGTACCAMEYQVAHLKNNMDEAVEMIEALSPSESDLLIVSGTINHKYLPYVLETYEKMISKKWVIAVGACASSGGPYNTYNTLSGIGEHLPVDVYVPGCPPTPEAILEGMKLIQQRILKGVCASKGSSATEVLT